MSRPRWVFAAKLALTLVALFLIVRALPLRQLQTLTLRPAWMVLAMAALTGEFLIAAGKLRWLLGFGTLALQLRISLTKVFFNQFLPGGLGGEAARWTYLNRMIGSHGQTVGLLFSDRWSGFCTQIFWSGCGLWLFARLHPDSPSWIFPASLSLVMGGLVAWFLGPRLLMTAARNLIWLRRFGPLQSLGKELDAFHATWLPFFRPGSKSWRLFLWACANQISLVALMYLASRALGIMPHPLWVPALFLMGSLSALLPLTLGGFGIQEGFFGYAFLLSGSGVEEGIAVSLLLRLLLFPFSLAGGILFWRGGQWPERPPEPSLPGYPR